MTGEYNKEVRRAPVIGPGAMDTPFSVEAIRWPFP